MHEFSLCQNLLSQVLATAAQHQATAIKGIDVRLRPLAGISADQLSAAFVTASAGTTAAGAELRIEELPLLIQCRNCGSESRATTAQLDCPNCGSTDTDAVSGDTLLITNIELLL